MLQSPPGRGWALVLICAPLEGVAQAELDVAAVIRLAGDLTERPATRAAVNAAPAAITSADVKRVRNAGWSDDAIYDAITVCALFRFYNTWVDASGVAELSRQNSTTDIEEEAVV
jgi:alkylhydroperoxidase family enzyme